MNKRLTSLAWLMAAALVALPSCSTNVQGDDASPVFLTVSFDLAPLQKNVASGTPLQIQTITLNSRLKKPTSGVTTFLDTLVDDYVVEWHRIDGGTVASPTQTFAGNVLVPAGGTSTLSNFPVMSAANLLLPPLDQLFPFNGGVDRETRKTEIRQSATLTFRGHTLAGQPVRGTGTLDMIFIGPPVF